MWTEYWYWPAFSLPVTFLIALLLGLPFLVAGAAIELRQYRRLAEIPPELARIRLVGGRALPPGPRVLGLLTACVVVCPPPLGRFMALVRRIIGGRLDYYHRMADRTRREALLRLREQAAARGADGVGCIRLETVRLGGNSVALMAYGTALTGAGALPSLPEALAGREEPSEGLGGTRPHGKRTLALLILATALAGALAGLVQPVLELLFGEWINFG